MVHFQPTTTTFQATTTIFQPTTTIFQATTTTTPIILRSKDTQMQLNFKANYLVGNMKATFCTTTKVLKKVAKEKFFPPLMAKGCGWFLGHLYL